MRIQSVVGLAGALLLALVLCGCGQETTTGVPPEKQKQGETEGERRMEQEAVVEEAAVEEPVPEEAELHDIVDTAQADERFSTLGIAIRKAELVGALREEGPFTLFAPTDEAFEALPEGTLDDLLRPEMKSKLVAVLKYHVVPGKFMAEDVVAMESAATLNGSELSVEVTEEAVLVSGAKVTEPDIEASNGVIHAIDAVLIPEE